MCLPGALTSSRLGGVLDGHRKASNEAPQKQRKRLDHSDHWLRHHCWHGGVCAMGRMNTAQEITLWLGATRYYLGCTTYAVGEFADLLIEHWPTLDYNTRFLLQRDIEQEFRCDDEARKCGYQYFPLGADCDRAEWERVRRLWQ